VAKTNKMFDYGEHFGHTKIVARKWTYRW